MSDNGNESAYPHEDTVGVHGGMTKRERFAMAAMQGILGNAYWNEHAPYRPEDVAKDAVEYAGALLAALEGPRA